MMLAVLPLASGVIGLLAIGAPAPAADGPAADRSAAVRGPDGPVPPLPPADAPRRPFREALLHLTLLEAEFFEGQLERLEAGTYDLGVYNEMYEFFRRESHRLDEQYPGEEFTFDTPELSSASDRLVKARQAFQNTRFIAEQLENREKLGLDEPEGQQGSFEERALPLFRGYTAHYRDAADRIRRADPDRLEGLFKDLRGEGLRMNRALRRLSADFPDRPSIFGDGFAEEPLRSAHRELNAALADYQAARKQKADSPANAASPQ
jgi:hypothetical protein